MRPPLYQLLASFSSGYGFHFPLPYLPFIEGVTNGPAPQEPSEEEGEGRLSKPGDPRDASSSSATQVQVIYRPRVTFNKRLVLTRRCWMVPGVLYPQRQPQEGEADYFLRVARWRQTYGIPREVYVKFNVHAEERTEDVVDEILEEAADQAAMEEQLGDASEQEPSPEQPERLPPRPNPRALLGDLRKPQYIDFSNPLLVILFGTLPSKLKAFSAIFEERLPGRQALFSESEHTFVTELVLQIDFPEQETEGSTVRAHGGLGSETLVDRHRERESINPVLV